MRDTQPSIQAGEAALDLRYHALSLCFLALGAGLFLGERFGHGKSVAAAMVDVQGFALPWSGAIQPWGDWFRIARVAPGLLEDARG